MNACVTKVINAGISTEYKKKISYNNASSQTKWIERSVKVWERLYEHKQVSVGYRQRDIDIRSLLFLYLL